MTMASPRGFLTMTAFPRSRTSILITVAALAIFLVMASCLLVSNPLGSTVQSYFYSSDTSQKVELGVLGINKTETDGYKNGFDKNLKSDDAKVDDSIRVSKGSDNSLNTEKLKDQIVENPREVEAVESSGSSDISEVTQVFPNNDPVPPRISVDKTDQPKQNPQEEDKTDLPKENPQEEDKILSENYGVDSANSGCDLYHGKWFYDSSGPLYTNNSCPMITQMQNCQGNGRPDREYENWRWKPSQCDLPRFDAKKFLELMRGKTLAFIGDSVARNQMESLLCILWQVETPKNRGNKKMQRWHFRSTSTMIVRMWSSWLVHRTSQPLDIAPENVVKLHLDAPDEFFMDSITRFDVIVLSSGHWFAKQSVYMLNNEVVGGQLWWPDKSRPMKVNNIDAFGISVETILTAMATHPNYTGLTLVRSYSPDHYEGGAWNTGGSCTGKVKPIADGELPENEFTKIMYEKQVSGFNRAFKKAKNKSKLKLMDITEAFGYRHDGHPGPYRSPDPNKITKRGPDGKPPPQDCLHWCMPGPVDMWNELVLENIRREFEGSNENSSL